MPRNNHRLAQAKRQIAERPDKSKLVGHKIPPDPEELNGQRATWAAGALLSFMAETGCDLEDALGDLLANMGHWCDRNAMDMQAALRRAAMHYREETDGEGKQFPKD